MPSWAQPPRSGDHRSTDAAQKAIASPLLEAGAIDGARGILINITGSSSLKLAEVQQACTIIQGAAHEDANIIFGAVLDEKMKDSGEDHRDRDRLPRGARRCAARGVRTPSFASTHNDRMDFPEPAPAPRFEPDPAPVPERIMMEDVMEAPIRETSPAAELAQFEPPPPPIDVVRNSMAANFEQDNLDVPAFLRKRGEIM